MGEKNCTFLLSRLAYESYGQQRKVGRGRVALFLGGLHSPHHKSSTPSLELVGCMFLSVSTMLYTAGIWGFSGIIRWSVLVLWTPHGLTAVCCFLYLHPLHCMWVLYCNHSFPESEIPWFCFLFFFFFKASFSHFLWFCKHLWCSQTWCK